MAGKHRITKIEHVKSKLTGQTHVRAFWSNGEIAFHTETMENITYARGVAKFYADAFDAKLVDKTKVKK